MPRTVSVPKEIVDSSQPVKPSPEPIIGHQYGARVSSNIVNTARPQILSSASLSHATTSFPVPHPSLDVSTSSSTTSKSSCSKWVPHYDQLGAIVPSSRRIVPRPPPPRKLQPLSPLDLGKLPSMPMLPRSMAARGRSPRCLPQSPLLISSAKKKGSPFDSKKGFTSTDAAESAKTKQALLPPTLVVVSSKRGRALLCQHYSTFTHDPYSIPVIRSQLSCEYYQRTTCAHQNEESLENAASEGCSYMCSGYSSYARPQDVSYETILDCSAQTQLHMMHNTSSAISNIEEEEEYSCMSKEERYFEEERCQCGCGLPMSVLEKPVHDGDRGTHLKESSNTLKGSDMGSLTQESRIVMPERKPAVPMAITFDGPAKDIVQEAAPMAKKVTSLFKHPICEEITPSPVSVVNCEEKKQNKPSCLSRAQLPNASQGNNAKKPVVVVASLRSPAKPHITKEHNNYNLGKRGNKNESVATGAKREIEAALEAMPQPPRTLLETYESKDNVFTRKELESFMYVVCVSHKCRRNLYISRVELNQEDIVVVAGDRGPDMGCVEWCLHRNQCTAQTSSTTMKVSNSRVVSPNISTLSAEGHNAAIRNFLIHAKTNAVRLNCFPQQVLYRKASTTESKFYYSDLGKREALMLKFIRGIEFNKDVFETDVRVMEMIEVEIQADLQKMTLYYTSTCPIVFFELAQFLNRIVHCRVWCHDKNFLSSKVEAAKKVTRN